MRTSRLPINMGEQLAVRPGNRQLEPGLGPPVAVLENPVARAVLVALENPAVQVALAGLVRQLVPVLVRQQAAAVSQVVAAEREAQTRSVAISHRRAAVVVGPLLAGVGALLKPRATGVAVA